MAAARAHTPSGWTWAVLSPPPLSPPRWTPSGSRPAWGPCRRCAGPPRPCSPAWQLGPLLSPGHRPRSDSGRKRGCRGSTASPSASCACPRLDCHCTRSRQNPVKRCRQTQIHTRSTTSRRTHKPAADSLHAPPPINGHILGGEKTPKDGPAAPNRPPWTTWTQFPPATHSTRTDSTSSRRPVFLRSTCLFSPLPPAGWAVGGKTRSLCVTRNRNDISPRFNQKTPF